jgi:hypothetical protein
MQWILKRKTNNIQISWGGGKYNEMMINIQDVNNIQ